ncbi:pyroglutamyl-peptidase I [Microbacterium sp. TNHR37B]|uniref:pyroglutamyl-peptidase I n=1 Tax=Microbacterium sp. TNHR37B TaxID=1775956 RepID=UPI0007B1C45E|nr:pyroglutamyl-peptidase I [Microbacterium sp. TNHR37B]KZE88895.1 Pyrrolidone-carboxylate peptidase [Microbacterium sp. TNHR37B]
MTTVLLTGFEPFGGDAVNPSGEAVRQVAAQWDMPARLVTDVLPVTFEGAAARLRELLTTHRPDVVLATGLAGGRAAVGVERIAVNLLDARIPDNAGHQPIDVPSMSGAPAAAFATVPVKAVAAAIVAAGIPAEVSHSAGTFVCNHVFFTALQEALPRARVGFVHVPWSREHAPQGQPALPADAIAQAVRLAIVTTLDPGGTPALVGGALH